jgi:hypothetical protein
MRIGVLDGRLEEAEAPSAEDATVADLVRWARVVLDRMRGKVDVDAGHDHRDALEQLVVVESSKNFARDKLEQTT